MDEENLLEMELLQCLLHMPQIWPKFRTFAVYTIYARQSRAGACVANIVILGKKEFGQMATVQKSMKIVFGSKAPS